MKEPTSPALLPRYFRLKTGLRFGIITSIISSSVGIALYSAGLVNYKSNTESWIPAILLGLGIYLSSEYYKKHNQGFMGQGDIMVVSGWLGVFSGIVSAIFLLIQLKLDSTILSQMQNMLELQLEEKGLEGAQFDKVMEMSSMFLNPYFMGVSAIISSLIMSLIAGFILSFFLKKVNSDPFA
jgi:hypothetical protein